MNNHAVWYKDKRIVFWGNADAMIEADEAVTKYCSGVAKCDEAEARLVLGRLIDEKDLRATIMYDGNSIWSKKRLIRDLQRILRSDDMSKMTDYLYEFLHLECGSIAHSTKAGWISVYPTVGDLRAFFLKNERGQHVSLSIPQWYTDAQVCVEEMARMLELDKQKVFRVVWSIELARLFTTRTKEQAEIYAQDIDPRNSGAYVTDSFEILRTEEVKK